MKATKACKKVHEAHESPVLKELAGHLEYPRGIVTASTRYWSKEMDLRHNRSFPLDSSETHDPKVPNGLTPRRRVPTFKGLAPSSPAASIAKKANRANNTQPELNLRRELWRRGCRYRLGVPGLIGKPDLVFPTQRVVVFCDGDFWHGRGWRRLRKQLVRRNNASYWIDKIKYNRRRDMEVNRLLANAGWTVIRVWETELKLNLPEAASRIIKAVAAAKTHGNENKVNCTANKP